MGKTSREGLARALALALHDPYNVIATEGDYSAAIDECSGELVKVAADRVQGTGIFYWPEEFLLNGAEIVEPEYESDYWVSPMQRKIIATADRRPSLEVQGLRVDIEAARRMLLEPLLIDKGRADKYLQSYGLHKAQITDSEQMIRRLIDTGRPV